MKFIPSKITIIALIASITILFCSDSGDLGSDVPIVLTNAEIAELKANLVYIEAVPVEEGEIAVLETSLGTIKFKFFTDVAPNQCANFKKLANSGFYDWTTFHRVIPGFMIQGGDINSKNSDPRDDGTGDPGYNVDAEFSDIKHIKGIVSTARTPDINSAGSQFFIMHAVSPNLDGQYTVFGEVIEGMEVVDMIAAAPKDMNNRPDENIYMKRVRVIKP